MTVTLANMMGPFKEVTVGASSTVQLYRGVARFYHVTTTGASAVMRAPPVDDIAVGAAVMFIHNTGTHAIKLEDHAGNTITASVPLDYVTFLHLRDKTDLNNPVWSAWHRAASTGAA